MKNGLDQFGNFPASTAHYQKIVTPNADLALEAGYLKWYDIFPTDVPVDEALVQNSRDFLTTEVQAGRLKLDQTLGFVILHHCKAVVFLFACSWQNVNELWTTVYVRNHEADSQFQLSPLAGLAHSPVFCVWEMAPVIHERQAWIDYLCSKRDLPAKAEYIQSKFSGIC